MQDDRVQQRSVHTHSLDIIEVPLLPSSLLPLKQYVVDLSESIQSNVSRE